MAKSGDSPNAKGRRVWRFVFACLVLLAVVALWPLKGYSVDERTFGNALALPQLTFYRDEREGRKNARAMFMIDDFRSAREAAEAIERVKESAVPGTVREEEKFKGATVFHAEWANTGAFAMGFRYRNLAGGIGASDFPEEPGDTQEQAVTACLEAILDGLAREIPGVTHLLQSPRAAALDRPDAALPQQVFPQGLSA
jgi:hypothetical protein